MRLDEIGNHLYHVTSKEVLPSILNSGISRGTWAVYLCKDYTNWLGLHENPAVLKVDITGLKKNITYVDESLDEFLLWKDVELSRIQDVTMC